MKPNVEKLESLYRRQVYEAKQGRVTKRKIDGKTYYAMRRCPKKQSAIHCASVFHDAGFSARIVVEHMEPQYRYGVYVRSLR